MSTLDEARRERAVMLATAISAETGIPVEDILGRRRDPEVVAARHRLWTMLHDSGLSLSAIGLAVGVDHSSVRYALVRRGIATARRRAFGVRVAS